MQGTVIKGIGGFYYVKSDEDVVYECRARGKFRLDSVSPLPGDKVEFTPGTGRAHGYLTDIFERKNELVRPQVANVDQFVMVLSASNPRPDLLLCDKLLIQAYRQVVIPIIVLNKIDIAEMEVLNEVKRDYSKLNHRLLVVSAVTGEGLNELKAVLYGMISCLAGQSAVGKSSIINSLCKHFSLETGDLSHKIGRGRHTTRAAELLDLDGEGFVVDTPGFSLMDLNDIEPEDLQDFYPEMNSLKDKCRFLNCLHDKEPDCEIKKLAETGGISMGRYERYIVILEELREKRRRKYD